MVERLVSVDDYGNFTLRERHIGRLSSNGIYLSKRKAATSFYRKGQGYTISVSALNELEARGCEYVIILEERRDGSVHNYIATLQAYLEAPLCEEDEDGAQRCLPLRYMVEVNSNEEVVAQIKEFQKEEAVRSKLTDYQNG